LGRGERGGAAQILRYNLLDFRGSAAVLDEYLALRKGCAYDRKDSQALYIRASTWLQGASDAARAHECFGEYFEYMDRAGMMPTAAAFLLAGEASRRVGDRAGARETWKRLLLFHPDSCEAFKARSLGIRHFGEDIASDSPAVGADSGSSR